MGACAGRTGVLVTKGRAAGGWWQHAWEGVWLDGPDRSAVRFLVNQGGYGSCPSDDSCQLTDATGTHAEPGDERAGGRCASHEILLNQRDAWSAGQRVELVQRADAGEFRITRSRAKRPPGSEWCAPRNYIEHLAAMARAAGAGAAPCRGRSCFPAAGRRHRAPWRRSRDA